MPDYKGIQIFLVSQWELKAHPEFPHPDSSQFTFPSPVPDGPGNADEYGSDLGPLTNSDSKADRLLGRQSCVSVYVPSLPGSRFWIQYKITEPALVHSEWYFFKLLMNGRHIASWGTNARTKPSGQVIKGLFEPSERWNYKHQGTVHKNMGTESRPFYFAHAGEVKSAASDGGLIEVLVFRARGRKRALAHPEEFKPQEHYGIFMPSGGLLEQPQDARFYYWHLVDPKDFPYAVFKYHYRSWDNLQSLQLIPANHPRRLLSPPTVFCSSSLSHQAQKVQAGLERGSNDEQYQSGGLTNHHCLDSDADDRTHDSIAAITSPISNTPWLASVFDESANTDVRKVRRGVPRDCKSATFTHSPKNEVPISRFSNSSAKLSETAIALNQCVSNQAFNRPLPRIPGSTVSKNVSAHSRTSSIASNSVSNTPSPIQSLNRDLTSPEPEVGFVTAVSIPRRTSVGITTKIFNYMSPPKVTRDVDSRSNLFSLHVGNNSILNYQSATLNSSPRFHATKLSDISNFTLRRRKDLLTRRLLHVSEPSTQSYESSKPIIKESASAEVDMFALSPSPSEWMFRIPSPINQQNLHLNCERMWAPAHEAEREEAKVAEHAELWTPNPQFGKKGQKLQYYSIIRKTPTERNGHTRSAREIVGDRASLENTDVTTLSTGWI